MGDRILASDDKGMRDEYGLNPAGPSVMWIDLNSAFATAEQQAHVSLRGRPLGVTNRLSKECCVIAASYEAKARGVKVGCRRSEALRICPDLVMLETDPPRYHYVYSELLRIMKDYTPDVKMKSIDEGVLDFSHTPMRGDRDELVRIGYEIKERVRREIGDYMKINVGISTNRFLAKTAAGLHKPDGLDVITRENLVEVFRGLKLEDLNGIASAFGGRLRAYGIRTPLEFLAAPEEVLRRLVFKGICGTYWHRRLRGYEIADKTKLGMVGRQWVVKDPTNDEECLRSYLHYLTETTAMKLRYRNVQARGVCVWMGFCEGGGFEDKKMYKMAVYTNEAIWERVAALFENRPKRSRVKILGVYLYGLEASSRGQLSLLDDVAQADYLTKAVDEINDFYGVFTVFSADSMTGKRNIRQKIPFGGTEYFDLLIRRK